MSLIIPRATWGAASPRSVSRCAWTGRTLWVHHSTGAAPQVTIAAERAWMRATQSFHQGPSRGWSDFGYGYAIAPTGRIYEGRGYQVWAAHCPGHNDEPSVCLMGDYSTTAPTDAQRAAVWALADHLGMPQLAGHREGYATSCPGDAAMRALVNAARPAPPKADPAPLPYGSTLRLVMQTAAERRAGKPGRTWAGWNQARGPLIWIRRNRIAPTTSCAISWRGSVWRGPVDVAAVASTLANRYDL